MYLVIVLGEFLYRKVNVVTITSYINKSLDNQVYILIYTPY